MFTQQQCVSYHQSFPLLLCSQPLCACQIHVKMEALAKVILQDTYVSARVNTMERGVRNVSTNQYLMVKNTSERFG